MAAFGFSHVAEAVGTPPEETAAQDHRISAVPNLLPGIGDAAARAYFEAVAGKDMNTGEEVSTTAHVLGSLVMLHRLTAGGKLIVDDVRGARKGRQDPLHQLPSRHTRPRG
ncbi:hypothetical protein J7E99_31120 [Streptomyces sp. ISL-44]|uniref:pre-toxin TG domain-containing protein n=1 Tax=Streptomyces sp. ISL-44 TaxID=2819184 RepID=UPI001BE5E583|nr:pre-toxin TG domain-containing protein [Streptomyces sp. ISL-44]MBT2545033.1 hypothetical protein [Streptomyces sp. ISL-44]